MLMGSYSVRGPASFSLSLRYENPEDKLKKALEYLFLARSVGMNLAWPFQGREESRGIGVAWRRLKLAMDSIVATRRERITPVPALKRRAKFMPTLRGEEVNCLLTASRGILAHVPGWRNGRRYGLKIR